GRRRDRRQLPEGTPAFVGKSVVAAGVDVWFQGWRLRSVSQGGPICFCVLQSEPITRRRAPGCVPAFVQRTCYAQMLSSHDKRPPKQRNLRIVSFATHATRGLLRDQTMRRKTMFWTVILALVMLFCGATVLAPVLDPKTRPGWFIFYWLA